MKYWEIIADNLSKAGWRWGRASAIDSNGANDLDCRMRIATENVSFCTPMKS
jgi:hypothetical protein